jgi:hypothetical protein
MTGGLVETPPLPSPVKWGREALGLLLTATPPALALRFECGAPPACRYLNGTGTYTSRVNL